MHIEYLLVLGVIGAFPLARIGDRHIGLLRRRSSLALTLAIVSLVFWIWDIAATARGHWSFNPEYVLGVTLLGLPLEEWLFFLVVSYVSVFTWESLKYFMREKP